MRSLALLLLMSSLAVAKTVTFGSDIDSIDIEFVEVGDPGNPAIDITLCFGQTQCETLGQIDVGRVDYTYSIAQFEISRDQFESVSDAANLGILLPPFSGFIVQPLPDWPMTDVSWNGAARFVNWLNSDKGYPPAYKFRWQPEDAEYSPRSNIELWQQGDEGFDPKNPVRNRLAKFVLPSLDEWHKAAYFDSEKNDGSGGYREWSTGDSPPVSVPFGSDPGTAVYNRPTGDGPADVRDAGGRSKYGAMAMNGNVFEWTDTILAEVDPNSARVLRGGDWSGPLTEQFRIPAEGPRFVARSTGFRVAMVPPMELTQDSGDFNLDGLIDATDINLLSAAVVSTSTDDLFDLSEDGEINNDDRVVWVEEIVGTFFGDVDLNKEVDFDDFLSLSVGFNMEGGWENGDVDGNGFVDFDDFLGLSANFGNKGEGVVAAAVPEPSGDVLTLGLLMCFAMIRRSRE